MAASDTSYRHFVISRPRTRALDIKTAFVVHRSFSISFCDQSSLSFRVPSNFHCCDFAAFTGRLSVVKRLPTFQISSMADHNHPAKRVHCDSYPHKAWFPYRSICRVCRTKKIHRTDRIHSISYNKLYVISFVLSICTGGF